MDVLDPARGEPAVQLAVQERLDVGGGQLRESLSFLDYPVTTGGVSLPSEGSERTEYDGIPVREALDQLADEHRLSYSVDFDKDLHLFRTETVSAPWVLDDTDPDYSTSFPYSGFTETGDTVELAERIYVIGEKGRTWVGPGSGQERSIDDPELVTAAQRTAARDRAIAELGTRQIDGSLLCWRAVERREHVTAVHPAGTGDEALHLLPGWVGPESRDSGVGEHGVATTAVGLGLQQRQVATDVGQRVADPQPAPVQVHVLPAQPQQLAVAQAGPQHRDPERPMAVIDRRLDKGLRLLGRERCDLVLGRPRRVDELRDVAGHHAPFLGGHERAAQHGMDVLDATRRQPTPRGTAVRTRGR